MATPAEMLLHKIIAGWTVVEELGTYPGATGGHFSTGYIVEKNGQRAFLKAMDLSRAFALGLPAMQNEINQYLFEKNLLTFCKDKRLSGVIRLFEAGEVDLSGTGIMNDRIYYFIFELADGDIRREMTVGGLKDDAWKLLVLHRSAVALFQLHGAEIAHQDLKPSNVLSFKAQDNFKIGDLGRCASKKFAAPTDVFDFPGDRSYAPPEYHYKYVPPSYTDQRLGSDAYLLGSLISFLFAKGIGALNATLINLPDAYWHNNWNGSYLDALPFILKAHTEATLVLKQQLPEVVREELGDAYFNLCHPDPELRGHPAARRQTGRPIGIDRYRTSFDLMLKKVRLAAKTDAQRKLAHAK